MKNLLFLLLILSFSFSPIFSATPLPITVTHIHPVAEVVYVTKTGTKYYKGTCHYLKRSKIKTTKIDAKKSDYSACIVCKP